MDREKKQSILLSIAIIVLFSGCHYYINHQGIEIEIPESDIQKTLSSVEPSVFRYKNSLAVKFNNPKVFLQDDAKVIVITMDLAANISADQRIIRKITGNFEMAGDIRYSPAEKALFLNNTRINAITAQNLPQENLNAFRDLLLEPLANYYAAHPIYILSDPSKSIPAKYILKRAEIRNHQLLLLLGM